MVKHCALTNVNSDRGGDEQMLRILGRGHSVPTVTEFIFVRAQCFTIVL
jgi:hypothetical protein